MKANYRHMAREHLKCAQKELSLNEDLHLRHAALELRMAMEALTYDRALAFKDEFPPDEYKTWQPRKVMLVLLEIDSNSDKDSSLAIGLEKEHGVPAPEMKSLGSETVLNMKSLRDHYDALGNFLHVQSLKQTMEGIGLDFNKVRTRCETIQELIKNALSSPIFNITLGQFSTMVCDECGNPIRKRIPEGKNKLEAKCHCCKATYTITDVGEGRVDWEPNQIEIECANTKCHKKIVLWHHELDIGRYWVCKACSGRNTFALSLIHEEHPQN